MVQWKDTAPARDGAIRAAKFGSGFCWLARDGRGKLGTVMEAVGGDGFLISTPFQRTNRRFMVEVTEGLVPALQRRGLMRTSYLGRTLRQVLAEY